MQVTLAVGNGVLVRRAPADRALTIDDLEVSKRIQVDTPVNFQARNKTNYAEFEVYEFLNYVDALGLKSLKFDPEQETIKLKLEATQELIDDIKKAIEKYRAEQHKKATANRSKRKPKFIDFDNLVFAKKIHDPCIQFGYWLIWWMRESLTKNKPMISVSVEKVTPLYAQGLLAKVSNQECPHSGA